MIPKEDDGGRSEKPATKAKTAKEYDPEAIRALGYLSPEDERKEEAERDAARALNGIE